jgi:aspartate-semialdehyde dehydrogenase
MNKVIVTILAFGQLLCLGLCFTSKANHLKMTVAPPPVGLKPMKVGIVGKGAVGQEIIGVLQKRGFPVKELHVYARKDEELETPFGTYKVEPFDLQKAREMDIVFLAVDGKFATDNARQLSEGNGPIVIDNSSAFRYEKDVPLLVPEINAITAKGKKLIANPNCTTAIGLMALAPIHREFIIKRCIMSTYQAASGAGKEGMDELKQGVTDYVNGKEVKNEFFAHPLPFNLIPHIDVFQPNDYTKEEMKVTWETRKILGDDNMLVSCTAVRIPTMRAHAESITIETEKPIDVLKVKSILAQTPGVELVDDIQNKKYPMPLYATGQYDVQVGRIRKNEVFGDKGLDLFVCGDQLLRGAALNAVLAAEACLTS